eukprot:SAG31_NODE_603_length_13622_cov_19.019953_10_plen_327_part_00
MQRFDASDEWWRKLGFQSAKEAFLSKPNVIAVKSGGGSFFVRPGSTNAEAMPRGITAAAAAGQQSSMEQSSGDIGDDEMLSSVASTTLNYRKFNAERYDRDRAPGTWQQEVETIWNEILSGNTKGRSLLLLNHIVSLKCSKEYNVDGVEAALDELENYALLHKRDDAFALADEGDAGSQTVSLLDEAYAKERLCVPVRGHNCQHMRCFDFRSHLSQMAAKDDTKQLQENWRTHKKDPHQRPAVLPRGVWFCPFCGSTKNDLSTQGGALPKSRFPAGWSELYVDGRLLKVLRMCDADSIELTSDGGWKEVAKVELDWQNDSAAFDLT